MLTNNIIGVVAYIGEKVRLRKLNLWLSIFFFELKRLCMCLILFNAASACLATAADSSKVDATDFRRLSDFESDRQKKDQDDLERARGLNAHLAELERLDLANQAALKNEKKIKSSVDEDALAQKQYKDLTEENERQRVEFVQELQRKKAKFKHRPVSEEEELGLLVTRERSDPRRRLDQYQKSGSAFRRSGDSSFGRGGSYPSDNSQSLVPPPPTPPGSFGPPSDYFNPADNPMPQPFDPAQPPPPYDSDVDSPWYNDENF